MLRAGLLAGVGLLLLAPMSSAFVYWADTDNSAIGRANFDGSGESDPFGSLGVTLPCSVAVDGRYVYWSSPSSYPSSIGRAPIDGDGKPDTDFIVGVSSPCGLAIYDHHLYWANGNVYGSIGRANLSGPLDVQENFVPSEQATGGGDLDEPCGIAVDASGIYWTDQLGGVIGHANLDGTGESTLLTGAGQSCGVALADGYLYWTDSGGLLGGTGTIGRALVSGAEPDRAFITGLNGPCGAAVDSNYIYFADGDTIDRAELDSQDPTASTEQIVMGTRNACGVAIDNLYAGQLTIGSRLSRQHGTVILTVTVSNPGSVDVKQVGNRTTLLKPASKSANGAGKLTLILHPTEAAARLLWSHSSLHATLQITYNPAGGVPDTTTTKVTLTRR